MGYNASMLIVHECQRQFWYHYYLYHRYKKSHMATPSPDPSLAQAHQPLQQQA
jgi:hypothetical protein